MEDLDKTIAFINNPITDIENDYIGFETSVNLVIRAIKDGAKMIAITGDFGSGKTSLAKLVASNKKEFENPVFISLWYCVKESISRNTLNSSLIDLLKLFIYQLSDQIDDVNMTSYIHKRLSNNYGKISINSSKKINKWVLGVSIGIFTLPIMFRDLVPYIFSSKTPDLTNQLLTIFYNSINFLAFQIGKFYPVSNYISLIVLFFALAKANVVFSLWDSQGKRVNDEEETLEVYEEIIRMVCPQTKDSKIKIIVVEDSDRIVNKKLLVEFLRVIYRINRVVSKNEKLVFIVTLKPESELLYDEREIRKSVETGSERKGALEFPQILNNYLIYPKIFDFIINVRPIYIDDYRVIVEKLLQKEKRKIESLACFENCDTFPTELSWLITGKNLTIREIKNRLNAFFSLYTSLKNRVDSGEISATTCAAITYLEYQYPKEFIEFIRKESKFSEFMQNSFINRETATSQNDDINKIDKDGNRSFESDLADMVKGNIFNIYSRMYFYSYPRDCYINNFNENQVVNIISSREDVPENFDELLRKVIESKNGAKVVNDLLALIISKRVELPKCIFASKELFELSIFKDYQATINSFNSHFEINHDNYPGICEKIIEIAKIHQDIEKFIYDFLKKQLSIEAIKKNRIEFSDIINIRLILHNLLSDYREIRDYLYSPIFPMIVEDEIGKFANCDLTISCIDPSKIAESNSEYLLKFLSTSKFSPNNVLRATQIVNTMFGLNVVKNPIYVLEYMISNHIIDDQLQRNLNIDSNSKKDINDAFLRYINVLSFEEISAEILGQINNSTIYSGLSEFALRKLFDTQFYIKYFSVIFETREFKLCNFADISIINILKLNLNEIFINSNQGVLNFREFLCANLKKNLEDYLLLFRKPFPKIKANEIQSLLDLEDFLRIFDFTMIDQEDSTLLIYAVNNLTSSGKSVLRLIKLLSDFYLRSAPLSSVALSIIDKIDYKKLNLNKMKSADVYPLFESINKVQKTQDSTKALELMPKLLTYDFVCLNASIDQFKSDPIIKEKICNIIELIGVDSEIVRFTSSVYLDFKFSKKNTTMLLKCGDYNNYLSSQILNSESNLDTSNISPVVLLDLFENTIYVRRKLLYYESLMSHIIMSKNFGYLHEGELLVLSTYRQTSELITFIFSQLNSEQINLYLTNISDVFEFSEYLKIRKVLCEEEKMKRINEKTYYYLKKFLPKNERGMLTRKFREFRK